MCCSLRPPPCASACALQALFQTIERPNHRATANAYGVADRRVFGEDFSTQVASMIRSSCASDCSTESCRNASCGSLFAQSLLIVFECSFRSVAIFKTLNIRFMPSSTAAEPSATAQPARSSGLRSFSVGFSIECWSGFSPAPVADPNRSPNAARVSLLALPHVRGFAPPEPSPVVPRLRTARRLASLRLGQ